jgi:hypothetical protein
MFHVLCLLRTRVSRLRKGLPITHFKRTLEHAEAFNERAMYKMVAASYAHRRCFEDYSMALNEWERAVWRVRRSKYTTPPTSETKACKLKYAKLVKEARMLMYRRMCRTLDKRERAADAAYENSILRITGMHRDMWKFWKARRLLRGGVSD